MTKICNTSRKTIPGIKYFPGKNRFEKYTTSIMIKEMRTATNTIVEPAIQHANRQYSPKALTAAMSRSLISQPPDRRVEDACII